MIGVLALQGNVLEHLRALDEVGADTRRVCRPSELEEIDVVGVEGGPLHAVFIRAPWTERLSDTVDVLAEVDGHPVLVSQGGILAAAFHPELTNDRRLHALFLDRVREAQGRSRQGGGVAQTRGQ